MKSVDIAVIGAGVAGASLAWHLCQAGLRVTLFERDVVGAGASGRNAGSLIPPLDRRLTPFYTATLDQIDAISARGDGAARPCRSGLLALAADEDLADSVAADVGLAYPELAPEVLGAGQPAKLEAEVAAGVAGVYIACAHTVDPLAVTRSFVDSAVASGVELIEHTPARVAHQSGRVVGVDAGVSSRACDAVVVCTGSQVADALAGSGLESRVGPVWGAVASMQLATPPRAILIEAEGLLSNPAAPAHALPAAGAPTQVGFGLVTSGEVSALGHSLGANQPAPERTVEDLLVSAERYLPHVRAASVLATRACARPTSEDDLPVVGPIPGFHGAYVLTGLGSRGLTIGPAVAGALSASLLDLTPVPSIFSPARFA